jgi:hypothetical protein
MKAGYSYVSMYNLLLCAVIDHDHYIACPATHLQPLASLDHQIMRSCVSSLNCQHPHFLKVISSCLLFLPRLPLPSTLTSITRLNGSSYARCKQSS